MGIDEAFTVHSLPVEAPGLTLEEARKWAHLSDIPFADSQCSEECLLIGFYVPQAHWISEQRVNGKNDPSATKTPLGWVLSGPLGEKPVTALVNCARVDQCSSISDQLKRPYDSEFTDSPSGEKRDSQEDKQALALCSKLSI